MMRLTTGTAWWLTLVAAVVSCAVRHGKAPPAAAPIVRPAPLRIAPLEETEAEGSPSAPGPLPEQSAAEEPPPPPRRHATASEPSATANVDMPSDPDAAAPSGQTRIPALSNDVINRHRKLYGDRLCPLKLERCRCCLALQLHAEDVPEPAATQLKKGAAWCKSKRGATTISRIREIIQDIELPAECH